MKLDIHFGSNTFSMEVSEASDAPLALEALRLFLSQIGGSPAAAAELDRLIARSANANTLLERTVKTWQYSTSQS